MYGSLTRAVPVILREGSLWQPVRASSAIPGIFSPVPVLTLAIFEEKHQNNRKKVYNI
jgi:predicted acylesterase/phospholipase RssA